MTAVEGTYVVCRLGDVWLGLPVPRVLEVLAWSEPRPIEGAPAFLAGVVEARGVVVPVIDLRPRAGAPDGAEHGGAEEPRIVAVELDDEAVGFIVDGVAAVARVPDEALETPGAAAPEWLAEQVTASARLDDGRTLFIVDPDRLLSTQERRALTGAEAADR